MVVSKGVRVALAGSLINFCFGIFYAWSVFADGLINELGWSKSAAMFPYTLELLVFSFSMVFGGRFQDRFGPRQGLLISGVFTGLALVLCALTANPLGVTLSFGVIFGSSAAFGYSAVTPTVLSWFPSERRGMVTGFILMSLGAAALIWAPVINVLIIRVGVLNTFIICGTALFTIIIVTSRFIVAAPISDEPEVMEEPYGSFPVDGKKEQLWRQIIRKPTFRLLWLMVGLTSGIGFMFIGHLVQIAELNYNIAWGYALVSLFALTNALGRLVGGALCDRIGFINNLRAALFLMIISMLMFFSGFGWPAMALGTLLLGFSNGSLYTTYPVIVAKVFGLKNFGINYGMIFTSIGIVGSFGPLVAAFLADLTGTYNPAFILGIAAVLFCYILVSELKKKT